MKYAIWLLSKSLWFIDYVINDNNKFVHKIFLISFFGRSFLLICCFVRRRFIGSQTSRECLICGARSTGTRANVKRANDKFSLFTLVIENQSPIAVAAAVPARNVNKNRMWAKSIAWIYSTRNKFFIRPSQIFPEFTSDLCFCHFSFAGKNCFPHSGLRHSPKGSDAGNNTQTMHDQGGVWRKTHDSLLILVSTDRDRSKTVCVYV